jgi:hypothetical protein
MSNELETEALEFVLGHAVLGGANSPRMVDAQDNKDGTFSIVVNDKPSYQVDFSLRDDMSWDAVVIGKHSKTWRTPDGSVITVMTHDKDGKPLVVEMEVEDRA